MIVNTKQVIIIRKDLNMRKGKMVAQGAHASMKVFFDRMTHRIPALYCDDNSYEMSVTNAMRNWMEGLFTKICVSVNSEQELLDIYNQALVNGLPCSLIQDAGLTEFNGVPTYTAVAIGPDEVSKIDPICKHLPLL